MSKSLKLKNNTFWDSSSIIHNGKKLSEILSSTILYDSSVGTNENVVCSENISNFEYLEITTKSGNVHKVKALNSFTLNEMTYFIENGIPYTANIVNTYAITEKNVNVVNKVSFLRNYSTGSINGDLSNNRLYIITIIGYKS